MKIKVALMGLLFASSIANPVWADLNRDDFEEAEVDVYEDFKEKAKEESKVITTFSGTVAMAPAFVYQDDEWKLKNGEGACLQLKGEVPAVWCDQDGAVNIDLGWDRKGVKFKKAAVTIGKMVTVGYATTIFGYEKADPALSISPGATVLQVKLEHAFDWFRIGYALESPSELNVGLFDKSKVDETNSKSDGEGDKDKKELFNQLDDPKDKKRAFKMKNSIPAVGLSLGAVTDHFNMALSGLLRTTDYTHATDPDQKKIPNSWHSTFGAHLGIQYKVVPEKFTVTAQGAYVSGLGDYIAGLGAIQSDEARKEMCAAYYVDKDEDKLSDIDAWGLGGTLEFCATPECTFSVRGSYLTMLEDAMKPASAFKAQWDLIPKVAYKFSEHWMVGVGYGLGKEFKVDAKKEKGVEQKYFGGIKFSF